MEALRNCRWWARKKMAGIPENDAEEKEEAPTREEETAGKIKMLPSSTQEHLNERTKRSKTWRWKSLWKQPTPPPCESSLFNFPGNAISLPVVLSSSKATKNEERDKGRRRRGGGVGGVGAVSSSVGQRVRETRLLVVDSDSPLAPITCEEEDNTEEIRVEQCKEKESARDFATSRKQGSVCNVGCERRSEEETSSPVQGTRLLKENDSICDEPFHLTYSTGFKSRQTRNNSPSCKDFNETEPTTSFFYYGKEGKEIISNHGSLLPAEEKNSTIVSRFRKNPSSRRMASNVTTIVSNLDAPSSTMATSCPPHSPDEIDKILSPFVSSPATATTQCRRRSGGGTIDEFLPAAGVATDDVSADTSPRTPAVAVEQFAFAAVSGVVDSSVVGEAYSTGKNHASGNGESNERRSPPGNSKIYGIRSGSGDGCGRPLLPTGPHIVFTSLETTPVVSTSAAGIRQAAAGSRQAASGIKPAAAGIRPAAAAAGGGGAAVPPWCQEQQQQQQQHQQAVQQQNALKQQQPYPVNATQAHQGKSIPQAVVRPDHASLEKVAANVSGQLEHLAVHEVIHESTTPFYCRGGTGQHVLALSPPSGCSVVASMSSPSSYSSTTAAAECVVVGSIRKNSVSSSSSKCLSNGSRRRRRLSCDTALFSLNDSTAAAATKYDGEVHVYESKTAATAAANIKPAEHPTVSKRSASPQLPTPNVVASPGAAECPTAAVGPGGSKAGSFKRDPDSCNSAREDVAVSICSPSLSTRPRCSSVSTTQDYFDDPADIVSQQSQQPQRRSSTPPSCRQRSSTPQTVLCDEEEEEEERNNTKYIEEARIAVEKDVPTHDSSIFISNAQSKKQQHSVRTPRGPTTRQSGIDGTANTSTCVKSSSSNATRRLIAPPIPNDRATNDSTVVRNTLCNTGSNGVPIACSSVKPAHSDVYEKQQQPIDSVHSTRTAEEKRRQAPNRQQRGYDDNNDGVVPNMRNSAIKGDGPAVFVQADFVSKQQHERDHPSVPPHASCGGSPLSAPYSSIAAAVEVVVSLASSSCCSGVEKPEVGTLNWQNPQLREKASQQWQIVGEEVERQQLKQEYHVKQEQKPQQIPDQQRECLEYYSKEEEVSSLLKHHLLGPSLLSPEQQPQQQRPCEGQQQQQASENNNNNNSNNNNADTCRVITSEEHEEDAISLGIGKAGFALKHKTTCRPTTVRISSPDTCQSDEILHPLHQTQATAMNTKGDETIVLQQNILSQTMTSAATLAPHAAAADDDDDNDDDDLLSHVVHETTGAAASVAEIRSPIVHRTTSKHPGDISGALQVLHPTIDQCAMTTPPAEREGVKEFSVNAKGDGHSIVATPESKGAVVTQTSLEKERDEQAVKNNKEPAVEGTPIFSLVQDVVASREDEMIMNDEKRETESLSAVITEGCAAKQLLMKEATVTPGVKTKATAAAAAAAATAAGGAGFSTPFLLAPMPFATAEAPAMSMVIAPAVETRDTGQGLTETLPTSPRHGEVDLLAMKKVVATAPVVSNNAGSTVNKKDEESEELSLTEAVLATVGQGVTTVLEYGATTLRDFITESLPALSSDEETSPYSSRSRQSPSSSYINGGRRSSSSSSSSSSFWRSSSSGSRKHAAARENQGNLSHKSVTKRRSCSAGTSPAAAEDPFQSTWSRNNTNSVLLPPPLLVRECMMVATPSAAGVPPPTTTTTTRRGRLPPPLSNNTAARTCRRSNSFSEAQYGSKLRQAWSLASLDDDQTPQSTRMTPIPSCFPPRATTRDTIIRRGDVEGVTEATTSQQQQQQYRRYVRASSPALSEPSSLLRRQQLQQQPQHLNIQVGHYHHQTGALTPAAMLAAINTGRHVSGHQMPPPHVLLGNKLKYDRGSSSAFSSVQNSPSHDHPYYRPLTPVSAGYHNVHSSLIIQPTGCSPSPSSSTLTQCGRLLLPVQQSSRMHVPSPPATRPSSRNTSAAPVFYSSDILTPHGDYSSETGPTTTAAGGDTVGLHGSETHSVHLTYSGVQRVVAAPPSIKGQQHRNGRNSVSTPPILPKSMQKEERRLLVRYVQQDQPPEQQQQQQQLQQQQQQQLLLPSLRQGHCSPSGGCHRSPYRGLSPTTTCVSQTRGNQHMASEADAQGRHMNISSVQNLQTAHSGHSQEQCQELLVKDFTQQQHQQQHQYHQGGDTHVASAHRTEFLSSYTHSRNDIPALSSAWRLSPSSSCSNTASFRHSSSSRDPHVFSTTGERQKTSSGLRYTSPHLSNDCSSSSSRVDGGRGAVELQYQNGVQVPQQQHHHHHLLRSTPHAGPATQRFLLPAVDFSATKQYSTKNSPPSTVRQTRREATCDEPGVQSHHAHIHTQEQNAGEKEVEKEKRRAASCSLAPVHMGAIADVPMLVRTQHTADVSTTADVQGRTDEHNTNWCSSPPATTTINQCGGQSPSWLCDEQQQQRYIQCPESNEHQLQYQDTDALHRGNPTVVHGKSSTISLCQPAVEMKGISSGPMCPTVIAGVGSELTENARPIGMTERSGESLTAAVQHIHEVSNTKNSPIQRGALYQHIYQDGESVHPPEQNRDLGHFVHQRDGKAAGRREIYEEACVNAPHSTHRDQQEIRITAPGQDATILTRHDEPTNMWGIRSSIPVCQQNYGESCSRLNLSIPNLTTETHRIASALPLARGSPGIKDRNDTGDALTTPVETGDGGVTVHGENAKTIGKATRRENAQPGDNKVLRNDTNGEHPLSCNLWRHERMPNFQFTVQQQESQESQHCQQLSEVRQQQQQQQPKEGFVRQRRLPSPLRARCLREDLIRKRATGQLCKETFPLEEVENLLQNLQVKKVNGVLVYDIGGQEDRRGILPQNEATGATAFPFSLPDSRSASGFNCNNGPTAGMVAPANEEQKDENATNVPTVNTCNTHAPNSDGSISSHSCGNTINCCKNSSRWCSGEGNQDVGRNTCTQTKFENSQYDNQSTQCSSSHFDVWLQDNHRVGEQFLKDVEQIVDVAASLYGSHETSG